MLTLDKKSDFWYIACIWDQEELNKLVNDYITYWETSWLIQLNWVWS